MQAECVADARPLIDPLIDPKMAEEVDRAVDSVRAKFGAAALKRGSVLDTSDG